MYSNDEMKAGSYTHLDVYKRQVFDRLEKGKFKDWENVKYFGIKKKTSEKVREQVKVGRQLRNIFYLCLVAQAAYIGESVSI